jgi:hypothetical protein
VKVDKLAAVCDGEDKDKDGGEQGQERQTQQRSVDEQSVSSQSVTRCDEESS